MKNMWVEDEPGMAFAVHVEPSKGIHELWRVVTEDGKIYRIMNRLNDLDHGAWSQRYLRETFDTPEAAINFLKGEFAL